MTTDNSFLAVAQSYREDILFWILIGVVLLMGLSLLQSYLKK